MKWFSMQNVVLYVLILSASVMAQKETPPLLKEAASASVSDTASVKGKLTLPQALNLAMRYNPQLSVFSLEIRVREAAAVQAALWPNPELELEAENFAGSGPLSAFKATETTVSVGQLIEVAGKRAKRVRIAKLGTRLAEYDFQVAQLNVFTQTVSIFTRVLAAQELVELNRKLVSLAETFKENIAKRVQAGRLSPAELSRAEVEVANARINLQRREKELAAARRQLAATWGATRVTFDAVSGSLENVSPVPEEAKLQALIRRNPILTRWQVVARQRETEYRLAKAGRIPDPVIRAGWRKFNDSGDQAFVAGLSIPLPLLNRNQGTVQQTAVRMQQTTVQKRSQELLLQTQLHRYYQDLLAAYESLRALKEEIIPRAENAFHTINEGYQQGKFGFLDVLDARRTLFASREAYLQNVTDYQLARAQIERLIGQPLETVQ
ncbi:MAG TPA: TolC family protein [Caldithrix abyssi]|uniref:TolC family protein n=1 Tax=Caldithrix abyssi TaxID=187145 RepID=A0A7V5PNF8_CALAY|nr:TolC family protein [Caldithrix abyssi]